MKELNVPEDSPAWARAAPALDFLKSPAPYSPLILPSFDEEEFMNRLDEDEDEDALEPVPDPIVTPGAEAANLAEEVGRTVVEVSEKRSAEETGVGGGEDEDQNSPS